MPKVLLADNETQLRMLVCDWLEHHHYRVDVVTSGDEAKEFLLRMEYDVLLFAWEVPGITGSDLCRWFRAGGGMAPILILSDKDDIDDKEAAFYSGADDFLTLPFALRELTARMNALMRRGYVTPSRLIKVGPLSLDPDAHTSAVDGKELSLTATEFAVLSFLARNPDVVYSAHALKDRVWNSKSEVSADIVRVYIKRLREKLQAVGYPDLVRNVYGVGYKLVAATQPIPAPVPDQSTPDQPIPLWSSSMQPAPRVELMN